MDLSGNDSPYTICFWRFLDWLVQLFGEKENGRNRYLEFGGVLLNDLNGRRFFPPLDL